MVSREITKEERSHWVSVLGETFRDILSQIVKANLTDPVKMGKMYAALVMMNYSSDILVDNKQESTIDWEENYLHECMIREMVCYRYLRKWTLGVSSEEDTDITKQWNEFQDRNKEEVDKCTQDVCLGFSRHMRSIHEKYPDLEHPVFTFIDHVDKKKSEKEKGF